MSSLNDLINQVENPELRSRIQDEVKKLAKQKKFGLVFEEHLPECTPLYDVPISVGKNISLKDGKASDIYKVVSIVDDKVVCLKNGDEKKYEFDIDKVVVTAVFGEPIYPFLKPIDKVCNAPESNLWHTLIEADNYHALQLLQYLYAGKVDCIYIDPPYNTGARDWKYNNNFVDENDAYRHSKWLSFMKKRLELAKKLLRNNGFLIITIDDNEFADIYLLIDECYAEYKKTIITIQMNPGGTQGNKFSVTNEYAIVVYKNESKICRKPHLGGDVYNLRRWGSTSNRYEGATCFYPVIINEHDEILGFGNVLDDSLHPQKQVEDKGDGLRYVWPLDINNNEKKWRYSRDTVEAVKYRMLLQKSDERIEVLLRRESEPPKTVWVEELHNAESHGTKLLKNIIGKNKFAYPKSLYAVKDCLIFSILDNKHALILDFFAGSGTTLHAVNLLNKEDGGSRRCILVTNNEVSDDEAKNLKARGLNPGDDEWEELGIARYVTWPRTKCSIQGVDIQGNKINGEYFTSLKKEVQVPRKIKQVALPGLLLSFEGKKSIVGLMGKNVMPQSLVKRDTRFIVSENSTASIIFDIEYAEDWLAELEENTQVSDIYIVTDRTEKFKNLKDRVQERLGDIVTEESVKIPMSEGFEANAEYFKLGFLDKTMVKIGRQFRELLPLLWMKSGAFGARPILNGNDIPEMLVLPKNKLAVLVNENKFSEFKELIEKYAEIEYVYIVTNYEQGYRNKIAELKVPYTFQLYRDYLDNFRINYRRVD